MRTKSDSYGWYSISLPTYTNVRIFFELDIRVRTILVRINFKKWVFALTQFAFFFGHVRPCLLYRYSLVKIVGAIMFVHFGILVHTTADIYWVT